MVKGNVGEAGELEVGEERGESGEEVILWAADAQYRGGRVL